MTKPPPDIVPRSFMPPEDAAALAAAKLRSSGIDPGLMATLCLRALTGTDPKAHHWGNFRPPVLAIDYIDPWTGKPVMVNGVPYVRYRRLGPDPAPTNRKCPRYMSRSGMGCELYIPPLPDIARRLDDQTVPLIIVEGEMKAIKLGLEDLLAVAVGGVDSFYAGGALLPLLVRIIKPGRVVHICFDSDPDPAPEANVARACQRLAWELRQLGAQVRRIRLPTTEGEKIGPDDFFVRHGKHAAGKFRALMAHAEVVELGVVERTVEELNQQYMMISEGGKAVIYRPMIDEELKRTIYHRSDIKDLIAFYRNQQVTVGHNKDGVPIKKSKAVVWLDDPHRRQFLGGLAFDPTGRYARPDQYNLWQGFTVEPKPGDWSLLRSHIRENICSGVDEHYNYVIGWFADMIQHPERQAKVALVLRGKEGVGKNFLVSVFMRILGQHALMVSNPRHLTGNFNAHLRDCVLLLLNEAFFAGDKSHVGVLKSNTTDETLTIERKFADPMAARNRLHIIIASNERWPAPAGLEARRFMVLDVSDKHMKDRPYFEKIDRQLDAGGYAALLHDLMNRDLRGFDITDVPQTKGLQDLKKLSLTGLNKWWEHCLMIGHVEIVDGEYPDLAEWSDDLTMAELHQSYMRHAKENGERSRDSAEQLGKFMREMGAKPYRPPVDQSGKRPPRHYRLGALADARKVFMEKTGLTYDWDSSEADAEADTRAVAVRRAKAAGKVADIKDAAAARRREKMGPKPL